jgi:hypothetical protein
MAFLHLFNSWVDTATQFQAGAVVSRAAMGLALTRNHQRTNKPNDLSVRFQIGAIYRKPTSVFVRCNSEFGLWFFVPSHRHLCAIYPLSIR